MDQDKAGRLIDFIAVGANRYPSSADWSSGLLAFGAGNNVALWEPDDLSHNGVQALLSGHTDVVSSVKIFEFNGRPTLVSGSADKTIRIWAASEGPLAFTPLAILGEHQGSVNAISTISSTGLFATGAADGTVKVWKLSPNGADLLESINLKPRLIPLANALLELDDGSIALAVAGTSNGIQIFVKQEPTDHFELQATLTGHDGWIRSLDFVRIGGEADSEFLLASASQDKFVRLWRLSKGAGGFHGSTADAVPAVPGKSLSNKAHTIKTRDLNLSITFEALLIGHEDWIYTAKWAPSQISHTSPVLLTASADNSLSFWQSDQTTGLWVCTTRLGEISSQKGSTTATGSTGGFWVGLWHPQGDFVVSLGRTGSWRKWRRSGDDESWMQEVGITGHTEMVQDMAWSTDGSYLLTTSSDQTTRLFAEWKRDSRITWHEMSRPQIHGYDLNCLDSLSVNQFISGADEKLLRVFNKPKTVDQILGKLADLHISTQDELPDAANIPVLGLSNKAVTTIGDDDVINGAEDGPHSERDAVDPASIVRASTPDLSMPPFEDHLARHTLWPEHEKLYGHGYEISAVAASHDGSLVATACKASSSDHAVIRLYETKEWREIRPALSAHTLTVTNLRFSPDDRYLLSVGRDRQWALFERSAEIFSKYETRAANLKGHSRMILDCSISNFDDEVFFATAGRDKCVKVWRLEADGAKLASTIAAPAPVTSVSFHVRTSYQKKWLAYGCEDGQIFLACLALPNLSLLHAYGLDQTSIPSKAVTAIRWRPSGPPGHGEAEDTRNNAESEAHAQVAVSSEDFSFRIYAVSLRLTDDKQETAHRV
ncbi:WD40 repeat-like protein [Polychaeton citri CBS 116435]|uniref:Elongator complex protein 2 n=1 Tax=Polychaeton citri CBS 116435 TaxID=1314669 RepID=A0A9P4UNE0_9PEZI|nr:WD40 repeat-like protein [Polychaeton citri CBS 116435]